MPYLHLTETCFEDAVGPTGLGREAYEAALAETAAALDWLRARRDEGSLPLLALPGRRDDLEALAPIAARLRDRFTDIVVLGTGGSSLGGQALAALAPAPPPVRVHFPDNLDGGSLAALLASLDLARTGFLVISKSGSTAETMAQALVCLGAVRDGLGDAATGRQFLAVAMPGDNPLRRLAGRWNIEVLDHDPDVGGRYSVLSLVGLLPALVMGLDAEAVRGGAAEVGDTALAAVDPAAAPPAVGAALSVTAMRHGLAATVVMPYGDRLERFAMWHRQLWAESLGKGGQGSLPVRALGPVDQHSQLQLYLDGPADKLYTLITVDEPGGDARIPVELADDPALDYLAGHTVGELVAAEARATAEALARNGRPTRLIRLARLDERRLGALFMHFMLETVIAARLLAVDPFDQPAVEQGKRLARQYLAETTASREAPP